MTVLNNQDLVSLTNTNLFVEDYNNEYIYVSEMPEYLGKGKNSFLIGIKRDSFQPDTFLNVFFLDRNNRSIPVVVTEYKQKMMIRCYIQIDQSHPVGFGTFVVIGTISKYKGAPVPLNWKLKGNIKHQKLVYVNPFEKTPSVLRFKNKPDIKLSVDQKRLYYYDMFTKSEYLAINDISIDKSHNDFLCLHIDTNSITKSVYYQKFLNYQLVDTISNVGDSFTKIFSGSVTNQTLPLLGDYYGDLSSEGGQPLVLDYGEIEISTGQLKLGAIPNNQIQLLNATEINYLQIYNNPLAPNKTKFGKYYIYLNNPDFLDIKQLQLKQQNSRIKQIQYVSKIQKAYNISLVTHYLSGSINISGGAFAQNMIVVTGSYDISGSYKDLQIKNPDTFTLSGIKSGQLVHNHIITHSAQYVDILATGNTVLTNCNLENAYIGHKFSKDLTTFDYIQGQLFSNNLFNRMQDDSLGSSYFSGSLRGTGTFYTRTSGSKLFIGDYTISTYDSESLIQMQSDYLFEGDGYNANLQVQWLSGSVYSSSLVDEEYYVYNYYPSIRYSKLLLESSFFNLKVNTISVLQISVPNGYTTPKYFNILALSGKSKLKLKSLTPITISQAQGKYELTGYFNINYGKAENVHFDGFYQRSLGFKEIQFYDMVDCLFTSPYQRVFGTKQIRFFDEDYSKIYVPIALGLNWRTYDLQSLRKYITSSINTNSMEVQIHYTYKNSLSEPTFVSVDSLLPLYLTIDDVEIYSGYFNSLQVFYNDTIKNENNYQLLSNVELPYYSTFPVTVSLDLPALGFSGESTNLVFKPKDSLGRYSPEQFFHYEYNVNLNAQVLLQQMKGYNVSYLGQTTVGGSVTSVNDMTGDVYLTAGNLPYDHSVLNNVGLALDYLFENGGGGSGSVGSVLDLVFSQSIQQFEIGSTQSANVTVSWVYSPRTYPTAIHCYIYSSSYPSQTDWYLATQSILNPTESCIQFQDDLTGSLKVVLEYMFGGSGLDTKSATAYIYFRNSVFLGKSTYVQDLSPLFSSLQNKYLAGDYKTCYTDTITDSKYIYIGFPNHMNTRQPAFVINDIAGGFESSSLVSYTNTSNYTQNYIFYRSVHNNLGYTNLAIKDPIQCLNSITYSSLIVSGGDTPEHNQLQGLQGGSIDQRYHISLDQYNQLRQYFISLSQPDPNSGSNGDIWLVYQE